MKLSPLLLKESFITTLEVVTEKERRDEEKSTEVQCSNDMSTHHNFSTIVK